MSARDLPARPNLEQYKKQAKELRDAYRSGDADAARRVRHQVRAVDASDARKVKALALTNAQFVIAREHGFDSWPKFAKHIETLTIAREVEALADPVAAFFEAAGPPRSGHSSGTLERAEAIRGRHPEIARSSIYAAAMIADEAGVRDVLAHDSALATEKGGPFGWDALTYLCFSRYLRLDVSRSDAFVRTAQVLLDAGANPNTWWYETIDTPPRQIIESAIYGAAGVAQHAGVTRLLLERGADPNDEETPYHVAETRNNDVLRILLESNRLNADSMTTLLLRKADWHDVEGMRLLLEKGANPNQLTRWSYSALHQSVRRDNSIEMTELLVWSFRRDMPRWTRCWSSTGRRDRAGRALVSCGGLEPVPQLRGRSPSRDRSRFGCPASDGHREMSNLFPANRTVRSLGRNWEASRTGGERRGNPPSRASLDPRVARMCAEDIGHLQRWPPHTQRLHATRILWRSQHAEAGSGLPYAVCGSHSAGPCSSELMQRARAHSVSFDIATTTSALAIHLVLRVASVIA
jgi:hypothetical protein